MRNHSPQLNTRSAIVIFFLLCSVFIGLIALEQRPEAFASELPDVPLFSVPGGYYSDDVLLALTSPAHGVRVRYTLDGSLPTADNGVLYTEPVRLSSEASLVTVVRARLEPPGVAPGPVVTQSYFVGVEAGLPLMSLVIDPADLWGAERGIFTHFEERGREWERPVDITFIDADRNQGFHVAAGARVHGGWTRRYDKKSLRLYFRRDYGQGRLTYSLYPGSSVTTFDRLVVHNGGNDSTQPEVNWTLLRNALVSDLALALGVNATRTRPVVVYVNGQPWGIYQLRERIDEQFLEDHYGITEAEILDSPANVWVGEISAGDRDHWDQLIDYLRTHDLRDPAAYAYVAGQVDLANLIDYTLLQVYSGNVDWPEHNVNQFRSRSPEGRWQWIVWDCDYSFGLNLHADVEFEGDIVDLNLVQKLLEDDHVATFGEDTLLIRKLLENPDFRQRFLVRLAELLNTTFRADVVVSRIDDLAAELVQDIDHEIGRWGSGVNWALSVERMRDYAQRRPDLLREHVVRTFGLPGVADLTFAAVTTGEGSVAVEGRVLEQLPWTGRYFRGTRLELQAVPTPGYRFAGWEGLEGAGPTAMMSVDGDPPPIPRFEPVPTDAPRAGDVAIVTYVVDDGGDIEGDWFEIRVERCGGLDLRGWRFTDNDRKDATDEGSLILVDIPALAAVPCGTVLRVVATRSPANDAGFPRDDLASWNRRMLLYVGNGHLEVGDDAWFDLKPKDNLAVLAPGATRSYADDVGIAFFSHDPAVSAASFGVLVDGVRDTRLPTPAP